VVAIRGLLVVLAAGGWVVSASKLRNLRRDPSNLGLRYLCVAQVALTLAITLQPIAVAVDRTLGIVDISRVTANCLTLVAAACGLAFGIHTTTPAAVARPFLRRQMIALGLCHVAIVALAVGHRPPYGVSDPRVTSGTHYQATPALDVVPYTLVYLGYLAWVLYQVGLTAHRNRAVSGAGPPLIALGVRMITAGAALGIGYAVTKAIATTAATWHQPWRRLDTTVAVLFSTAIIAILVGITLPSWGERVGADRLYERLVAWRSCRRLRPLWRLMVAAAPQIALLPHPVPAQLRRVRLTVEILDGYAALTPWMTPSAARAAERHADARNLDPHRREATVEAFALATAAHRKLAGHPPAADPTDHSPATRSPRPRATNAADQVAWLEDIARALCHLPPVTTTRHEQGTGPAAR